MRHRPFPLSAGALSRRTVGADGVANVIRKVRQESFFSPDNFAPIDLCPTSRRASNV